MRDLMLGMIFLFLIESQAQELKMDFSYKYIFSKQWDKGIQTYNFSRPFLQQKQPLLIHGLNTSTSYIFKSSKQIKYGIRLSYSYFRSYSENENLNNSLNLHFLNLGYLIHYENSEKTKGLYTDLIISAVSSGLFRKVNGEAFEYDDNRAKALGFGGDISFKTGYYIKLKEELFLSPYIQMGYTPYLFSPNSEVVINQTKELVNNDWTSLFTTQIGVALHFKKTEN